LLLKFILKKGKKKFDLIIWYESSMSGTELMRGKEECESSAQEGRYLQIQRKKKLGQSFTKLWLCPLQAKNSTLTMQSLSPSGWASQQTMVGTREDKTKTRKYVTICMFSI